MATFKRIYGSTQSNPEYFRLEGSQARMYSEQGRFAEAEKTF